MLRLSFSGFALAISETVVVSSQEGETQTTDSQTQLLQMLRKRGPCEAHARSSFVNFEAIQATKGRPAQAVRFSDLSRLSCAISSANTTYGPRHPIKTEASRKRVLSALLVPAAELSKNKFVISICQFGLGQGNAHVSSGVMHNVTFVLCCRVVLHHLCSGLGISRKIT